MLFDFDKVRELSKYSESNFFKCSTPYIERNLRDVGEVSSHYFESLRSLVIDVGVFLDMVIVIERSFEIPLLQKELSVSF